MRQIIHQHKKRQYKLENLFRKINREKLIKD